MPAEKTCPALFVTGTDTGVGKTLVAAAIARCFSRRGLRVGVMKPCETGVADIARPGEDAGLLRWAAGSRDADDLIAPYRFKEALAPALAAERSGAVIDPARIAEAYAGIARDKELMLVEGAGGLMVPLRGGFLVADLVALLKLPLLVVCRPTLGTINHTLLTIFAARTIGLPVAGFLVNRMPDQPGVAEREAPHHLASLASADILGVLPEVVGSPHERIEQLADGLEAMPTFPWLRHAIGLPE
jgi:dethiobiotin synthetase